MTIKSEFYSRRSNIWYFGKNAGLDFNSGTPVALTNGALNTWEGVATISDNSGNLMLYTDGVTVYNRNHQVMTNGTDLHGHQSSTQSAIVLPKPGDANTYYIFTVDGNDFSGNPPTRGFKYSVVEFNAANPNGIVVQKNIPLLNRTAEKVTAIEDPNGNFWVITHEWGNNNYYAYPLTASGVGAPVISSIGYTLAGDIWNAIGYLKVSPNGQGLAGFVGDSKIEIYDFNVNTGIISNVKTINLQHTYCYGLEFSPDGNYLYTVQYSSHFSSEIFQYNVLAGSAAAIQASAIKIHSITGFAHGAMQLGPDGKIYVTKQNYNDFGQNGDTHLGVINSPNLAGLSSNYIDKAVSLGGRTSTLGLPNFIQSNFTNVAVNFQYQEACLSEPTKFFMVGDFPTFIWNFGDPASGPTNSSTLKNPQHVFTAAGEYTVSLILIKSCGSNDTIKKTINIQEGPVLNLNDAVICAGSITLDAQNPGAQYLWSTGATTQTISVSIPGEYHVTVTKNGCTIKDTVNLTGNPAVYKRTYNWYFGQGAGLTFHTEPPSVLNGGQTNTEEGSATISDENGNLLFYSDGMKVWNKNHEVMPNGSSLKGHPSAAQGAVIIPLPEDPDKYYVFTCPAAETGLEVGINYSIVDMKLNGGLGDVTSVKNVLLLSPSQERITAVPHSNGRDIWVVTHAVGNNKFLSYLITPSGVSSTPVESAVGMTHSSNTGTFDYLGYIKASQQGDRIAIAIATKGFQVFDFNPATGILTNAITLPPINNRGYAVEFSPDGTKLYCSDYNSASLFQYDLSAGSEAAIIATGLSVGHAPAGHYGIQAGPDGKVYVSYYNSGYLSVINNPNAAGAASNFELNKIGLGKVGAGMPNFVSGYLKAPVSDFTYSDTCFGQPAKFVFKGSSDNVQWNFGDAASGAANTSTLKNPEHTFSAPGTYTVTLTVNNVCSANETITKQITIIDAPVLNLKDTVVCADSYLIDALNPGSTYLWSTGETTQTITVNKSGKYSVTVTKGCTVSDTVNVHFWGKGAVVPSQWYFGMNAGIDFTSGNAIVVSHGRNDADEGTATATDQTGNLLFYTNGLNVWDKTHGLMQNGLGLKSNPGYTQNSLFVPNSSNAKEYYLFTNGQDGIYYSVIDITGNGGKGSVISRDNAVIANTTEKLAGAGDDQGNVWIVTHLKTSNQFASIKLSPSGVNNTHVISSVGATINSTGKGYLKFSKDGTRIAAANTSENTVEIFNFNKITGQLSHSITLAVNSPYGIEFSEDGKYLYVTSSEGFVDANNGDKIYQFDLSSGAEASISGSKKMIAHHPNVSILLKALQLGPDGKIYVALDKAGAGFLSVINNPSSEGNSSGYSSQVINLGAGAISNKGLPNMPANLYGTGKVNYSYSDTCAASPTSFSGFAPENIFSWAWDFGDPGSANNSSNVFDPSHTFANAGVYSVKLTATHACGTSVVSKNININPVPIKPFGNDTTICDGKPLILDAKNAGATYLWNDGTTNQSQTVQNSGQIIITITLNGCLQKDTINVSFQNPGTLELGENITRCIGDNVVLDAGVFPSVSYLWNTGETTRTINPSINGEYKVTVTTGLCTLKDSIQVSFIPPPIVNLGNDTTICNGQSLQLNAGNQGFIYLWSTGATSQTLSVNSAGDYNVTVSSGNCQRSDEIKVSYISGPQISLPEKIIICTDAGETVTLDPGIAHQYSWATGENSQTLLVSQPGIYTVTASNIHGCSSVATSNVVNLCEPQIYVPKAFTPNGDGVNDFFELFGQNVLNVEFTLFNKWGEVIYSTTKLNEKWDGTYRGEIIPAGAYAFVVKYSGETINGIEEKVQKGDITVIK
ncbi:MAG: PKD domain-containing protein [Cytophagaceae bacterium]